MEKDKFIDPKSDYGFKLLFGTVANKELTIGFLNSLLEKNIKDITFHNVEMLGKSASSLKVIFDLLCETDDGEYFIVEIQKKKQQYFSDRVLYYASFAIQLQAELERKRFQVPSNNRERWKYRFNKVYVVCFLDFIMDANYPEKYRWDIVRMDRELKTPFSDTLNEIYLELPKFKLEFSECDTDYKRFLYILNHIEIMSRIPKQMLEYSAFLKKLKSTVELQKMTAQERLIYELQIGAERDFYICWDEQYEKGIEEGEANGKAKEQRLIATNLKKSGIDLQPIVSCTGLSLEEVEKL